MNIRLKKPTFQCMLVWKPYELNDVQARRAYPQFLLKKTM
jgi:hypothetical protein